MKECIELVEDEDPIYLVKHEEHRICKYIGIYSKVDFLCLPEQISKCEYHVRLVRQPGKYLVAGRRRRNYIIPATSG